MYGHASSRVTDLSRLPPQGGSGFLERIRIHRIAGMLAALRRSSLTFDSCSNLEPKLSQVNDVSFS
jgi:hypothetical protein